MTIVPADELSLDELAGLLNAGYEGYFVPVHFDAASLEQMVDAMDIDLSRSRVVPGDGVALLAVRGERGWIGGLGVRPAVRRSGVGRALMEAVLGDAPPDVRLEVIEANVPAIRLYEQLGFEPFRTLEVWSLSEPAEGDALEVDAAPLGQPDLPWQRQDESLPSTYLRLETDGGAALIADAAGRISVLQLKARDVAAARTLLASARSRGDVLRFLNVPEGDPASEALRDLGGTLDVRQLELRRVSRPAGPDNPSA